MLKRSKRIIKIILAISLISVVMVVGFKGINVIRGKTGITQPIVISQVRNSIGEKSVLHKEVILSKFESCKKIQIIQTTVKQEITISQGMKSGFFKNDKKITFTGIGKYIIDLNKIHKENIVIDNNNRTITMFTSKPDVEVELLEEKTQFQDDKGILSFYDVKLAPEELEKYKYEVKMQMLDTLQNGKNDTIIESKAKESLESLILQTTANKYKIIINFVK